MGVTSVRTLLPVEVTEMDCLATLDLRCGEVLIEWWHMEGSAKLTAREQRALLESCMALLPEGVEWAWAGFSIGVEVFWKGAR